MGSWEILKADFVTSAVRAEQYPQPALPEVAFIGRSNVGKSSLLNSLSRRKNLARVSSTPGKTQTLNFYQLEARRQSQAHEDRAGFYVVDLPGYGFARKGQANKDAWSGFISKYMSESEHLHLVCQLIDIRHKPQESDIACYQWLLENQLNVLLVLTKADKLSRSAAAAAVALFKRELGLDEAHIMSYSSSQQEQRPELIQRIMSALESGGTKIIAAGKQA